MEVWVQEVGQLTAKGHGFSDRMDESILKLTVVMVAPISVYNKTIQVYTLSELYINKAVRNYSLFFEIQI